MEKLELGLQLDHEEIQATTLVVDIVDNFIPGLDIISLIWICCGYNEQNIKGRYWWEFIVCTRTKGNNLFCQKQKNCTKLCDHR